MEQINIRVINPGDYKKIYELWKSIKGLGIRSIDDSEKNITGFIKRNPTTSFAAEFDGQLVGTLLCGHDGRRACFYHVCVAENFRNRGIATKMVSAALAALKDEGINKVNLMAFKNNETGNRFWQSLGWLPKDDVNLYEKNLNENNVTKFVGQDME